MNAGLHSQQARKANLGKTPWRRSQKTGWGRERGEFRIPGAGGSKLESVLGQRCSSSTRRTSRRLSSPWTKKGQHCKTGGSPLVSRSLNWSALSFYGVAAPSGASTACAWSLSAWVLETLPGWFGLCPPSPPKPAEPASLPGSSGRRPWGILEWEGYMRTL